MERKIARTAGGMAVSFLAALAALAVLVGCSGQSGSSDSQEPAPPVRGAPITLLSERETRKAEAEPAESRESELALDENSRVDAIDTFPDQAEPGLERQAANVADSGAAGELPLNRLEEQRTSPAARNEPPAEPEPEFLTVSFERLASFDYDVPEYEEPDAEENGGGETEPVSEIPPEIRKLNERKVALEGFMLPLRVEGGLVTEMLLMRDQSMCCYGTVPRINEWVSVKMSQKGVKAVMDQPVTLFGKLQVGEVRENGYLVGIYQMDAEKMLGPLDY